MRDDAWLQLRFNQIWSLFFPEVEKKNVYICWKGKWKNKFGHIKDAKNGLTEIAINTLFKDLRVPEDMIKLTIAHEIVHVIWKALSQANPEKSCAGWGKSIHNVTSGRQTGVADESPFVMYHWNSMPGGGAVSQRDGFNQIGHLIALGGLQLPNIETYEQLYPARFVRQEFNCDGGGAGKFRGGTGVHYEVEVEVPADYSFRGEGLYSPSGFGINGGQWGKAGEMTLYPENGEAFDAPK